MTNSDALYWKMQNEYNAYLNEIKTKSPKEIVEAAYEITYKQDILYIFEDNDCPLSEDEIKALLSKKQPLETLYQGWLDTDVSVMEDLRYSVKETAENFTNEIAKSKTVIDKESR